MAFASVGTLGGISDISAGTSIVMTTEAAAEAGNIVIVTVGKDNASSSDGNTSEVTSVTDSAGNTYTKAREFCNSQAAANAGATVAVYYSRLASQLDLGGTITASFSDTRTASSIFAWEFTGTAISVDGTPVDLANDGADAGSMALSGLTNAEHIFFRGIAVETGSVIGITPTTSYTGHDGPAGGVGAAGMATQGEFIIATATGHTSDPDSDDGDQAAVFIGFIEQAAGGTSTPTRMMMGVGT